ncbi:MAG: AAA family ATPase, partial [Pseudomonadota bacterium]
GREAVASVNAEAAEGNPVGFLEVAADLPEGTITCMLQADAWISEPPVIQGVWNLREPYKRSRRTLMLMARQIRLPISLQGDIVVMDEDLPDREALEEIARSMDVAAAEAEPERPETDDDTIRRVVDSTVGLSAFLAEQAVAMSLRKTGIDFGMLAENRRSMIEQTRGLSVDRGREVFDDIGGLEQAKRFGRALFEGPYPPALVVRVEEIEKVMAGSQGDLSGTSQDALQVVLNSMEDNGWDGIVAFGCPGAGKSLYSKALANTFGVLSLSLDLNATKGSLVGESEKYVREAMSVIKAIGSDRVFFVATANRLNTIPGELLRRFRGGIWMFDFPGDEERERIWPIHRDDFAIAREDKQPDDRMYAGSDIRNCCERAWKMGVTLREASQFIAPVGKTARDVIRDSRQLADGNFLSASQVGLYCLNETGTKRRSVEV